MLQTADWHDEIKTKIFPREAFVPSDIDHFHQTLIRTRHPRVCNKLICHVVFGRTDVASHEKNNPLSRLQYVRASPSHIHALS